MAEGTVLMVRKTFKASGVVYERGEVFDQAKAGMSGDKLRLLMSQHFISVEPQKKPKTAPVAAPKPKPKLKKNKPAVEADKTGDAEADEAQASAAPLVSPPGWQPGDALPQSGGVSTANNAPAAPAKAKAAPKKASNVKKARR